MIKNLIFWIKKLTLALIIAFPCASYGQHLSNFKELFQLISQRDKSSKVMRNVIIEKPSRNDNKISKSIIYSGKYTIKHYYLSKKQKEYITFNNHKFKLFKQKDFFSKDNYRFSINPFIINSYKYMEISLNNNKKYIILLMSNPYATGRFLRIENAYIFNIIGKKIKLLLFRNIFLNDSTFGDFDNDGTLDIAKITESDSCKSYKQNIVNCYELKLYNLDDVAIQNDRFKVLFIVNNDNSIDILESLGF